MEAEVVVVSQVALHGWAQDHFSGSKVACVDIKGLVMFTRVLCCIREPRG